MGRMRSTTTIWTLVAVFAPAFMGLLACDEPPSSVVDAGASASDGEAWEAGPVTPTSELTNDPTSDPLSDDPAATPIAEVCDGWDNDGDGEIDEGTSGDPCALPTGGVGTASCVGGDLLCEACTPGTVREEACGCGTNRIDVCGPDGAWRLGACDGCQTPNEPCECTPGVETTRRCDTCSGDACGTTCSGATWQCNDACEWVQLSGCEPLNPECNRDQVLHEPCGLCGTRRVVCDGCFWSAEVCEGEGTCTPGDARAVPCFDQECIEGYASSITGDDQCQWEAPMTCAGCSLGLVEESVEPCVPGYDCGEIVVQTVCVAESSIEICEGYDSVTIGILETTELGECDIVCIPGQATTEDCTLADGRAGTREIVCADTCAWGVPGDCGATTSSCIPETVDVEPRTCGTGACAGSYDRVRTCRLDGSGWSTTTENDTCPQCSQGETRSVSCTTSLGECGTRTASCDGTTCTWGDPTGECMARSSSCIPDTVETREESCGGDTCGATYTVTRRCKSNGCGWTETRDQSGCPECSPSETQSQSCITADNRCGHQEKTCSNSTCSWSNWSACQPLPDSCSNGAVDHRSCSGTCGSTGTERWECIGCAWQLTQQCDATPPCTPGEVDVLGECYPGIPACGYRELTCDANCNWVDSGCPPCG